MHAEDSLGQFGAPACRDRLHVREIASTVSFMSWDQGGRRFALVFEQDFSEIWDLETHPLRPLAASMKLPTPGSP